MGRGGQIYLSYTALVLLSRASGVAAGLWTVDIDLSPAPAPQDGPPFSANAIRDPAWLPYQIVGIVGSYLVTVFIIGTLILLVGHPARRKAQLLATSEKSIEMIRPRIYLQTPTSNQDSHWYSPRRLREKKSASMSIKSIGSPMSLTSESVNSFDASVVEADRRRRAEEMEKLYAAVMAQDERNIQTKSPTANVQAVSGRTPPRLITDAPGLRHLQTDFASPRSPVRAIYPMDAPMPMSMGPTSPIRADYPAPLSPAYHSASSYHNRSASGGSAHSGLSSASPNRKLRKSLKNLKISAPIMRNNDDNDDGARTPLSPRVYTDPGIPPEPPTSRTTATMDDAMYPPETPGTAISTSFGMHDDDDRIETEAELMDEVRDLPRSNPQRQLSTNFSQPLRYDSVQKQSASPIASVNNQLPFRQMHNQNAYQQLAVPVSAGPIKTTFVESKRDRLLAGTPKTGLATPYSAYMPFTPVTPITPHLSTRAERRQRRREERTIQGAITEEDQVVDDKELWDYGY